jgi:hypothetical protein
MLLWISKIIVKVVKMNEFIKVETPKPSEPVIDALMETDKGLLRVYITTDNVCYIKIQERCIYLRANFLSENNNKIIKDILEGYNTYKEE